MNRDIPGFYYDPEKKRYFRIESNRTAPVDAEWSATAVKRRKVEGNEAKKIQRRQERTKRLVKRASVLADPLLGGALNRELGHVSAEVPASCWARGLREKGELSFNFNYERLRSPNVQHMYIDGSDTKTGLGVAYASVDGITLLGHYIPTDTNDRINFQVKAHEKYRPFLPTSEVVQAPEMSSITYHAPTHHILLTSRKHCGVFTFSPELSTPDEKKPNWLIGECDYFQSLMLPPKYRRHRTNTCTPAPANSDLIYLLGTSREILGLRREGPLECIMPPESEDDDRAFDTFSIDFKPHDVNTFFAGGRYSRLWMIDLRCPPDEWDWWQPRSPAIAHVKALNEHHVLAAGIKSEMCIYDVRFQKKETTQPIVKFYDYKNEEHLDIGLDVNRSAGVVAAAHDDGKVAVYSLHSGHRLKAGDVDGIAADGPVKSMMFQTMPREKEASLFVGAGPYIQKYSFGTADKDEE